MKPRTLSELERMFKIRPPVPKNQCGTGCWRTLFDSACHEWHDSSVEDKIKFIRALPIPFLDLVRLFVKDRRRASHRYIIDDLPSAFAFYPLDLRPTEKQLFAILAEFNIKPSAKFAFFAKAFLGPQRTRRSIMDNWSISQDEGH